MDETGKRSLYVPFFTHPDMIQYEDRLQSFKNWSKQLMPDKYDMAEAGFLYTGQSDIVQCFGCNVRVSEWEKTDNAWREHLKWSPDCVFLKMVGYGIQLNTNPPIASKASPDGRRKPPHETLKVTTQPTRNGLNICTVLTTLHRLNLSLELCSLVNLNAIRPIVESGPQMYLLNVIRDQ
jgi:hypothetical protein